MMDSELGHKTANQAKGYTEAEVKKLYSCVTDGLPESTPFVCQTSA